MVSWGSGCRWYEWRLTDGPTDFACADLGLTRADGVAEMALFDAWPRWGRVGVSSMVYAGSGGCCTGV